MPLPIAYSKRALIAAIIKDVTNTDQPPDEFPISDNEMSLYIDRAAAFRMVGQAYNGAKLEGNLVVPEAYYSTYELPALTQDPMTRDWKTTLPQPPMSLPLGYNITRIYFVDPQWGQSQDVALIKVNRVGRRKNLPLQVGIRGWLENHILWLAAHDGASLYGFTGRIQMMSARTTNLDDIMNLPEDDIQYIFDTVKKEVLQRYGVPQDIINDSLPAGNKTS